MLLWYDAVLQIQHIHYDSKQEAYNMQIGYDMFVKHTCFHICLYVWLDNMNCCICIYILHGIISWHI